MECILGSKGPAGATNLRCHNTLGPVCTRLGSRWERRKICMVRAVAGTRGRAFVPDAARHL